MEKKKIELINIPYISLDEVERLLNKVEGQTSKKAGGNSKAYIFGDYVVLKTGNISLGDVSDGIKEPPFDRIIEKLHALKNSGVNVVPVLGYICNGMCDFGESAYGEGFVFQPRAKGSELWERNKMPSRYSEIKKEEATYLFDRASLLANASQQQFDKWVSDYKAITDAGIMIDPSKKENFFYDEEEGFSFIDLNFEREPIFGKDRNENFIRYCLLPCVNRGICRDKEDFPREEQERFSQFEEDNKKIFSKCVEALIKVGVKKEEIQEFYQGECVGVEKSDLKEIFENLETQAE